MPVYPDTAVHSQLQNVFGFDSFRDNQQELVEAILASRDVFGIMPTGGGKSLCYQLPASLLDGGCIVISPLISLMKDQVDAAVGIGLKAAYLNSTLPGSEQQEVMRRMEQGGYQLLYLSPERLALPGFMERLKRSPFSFMAVDEAHCVSEWGHDFRPDYLSLIKVREALPHLPVAAFTATATKKVQQDISSRLRLDNPFVVRASFDRPNLFYQVRPRQQVNAQIEQFVREHRGEAGIVYRLSRKDVEKTASYLVSRNISALPYHAGLDGAARLRNQEAFNRDDTQVIVATVAFGMGIDKSNVRFVVHGDLPKNMESYYQETGRAGRDNEPAHCLLLYNRGDYFRLRPFFDELRDKQEREFGLQQLRKMLSYAESTVCRRKAVLAYFDESYAKENCETCDICVHGTKKHDATVDAQKVMSAVYRTDQRFGITHIVDILVGSRNKRLLSFGHDRIKTYGIGKKEGKQHWRMIIESLLAHEKMVMDGGEYPLLKLTTAGENILFGREQFVHRVLQHPEEIVRQEVGYNPELFTELQIMRREMADAAGVPPFVVFSDRSLHEMCSLYPENDAEFLMINGVGSVKLDQYGETFMGAIKDYLAEHPEIEKKPIAAQRAPVLRREPPGGVEVSDTLTETLLLARKGLGVEAIASARGLKPTTISSHIEKLFLRQEEGIEIAQFVDSDLLALITEQFLQHGYARLKPVVDGLTGKVTYDQARIARGHLTGS